MSQKTNLGLHKKSRTSSQTGIPDLAYHPMYNSVILENTFTYLSVEDLKICRRVCKYWKAQARFKIQQISKCKLWANCYEAQMDTNSINSFYLSFYTELEVDYIPTSTFHIVNPGNDEAKRFIEIFGDRIQNLILDFQGSVLENAQEARNENEHESGLTEDELQKRQIYALLNFPALSSLKELRIQHARDHFDNVTYTKWAQTQNLKENEISKLTCVKALTLAGRYTTDILKNIFCLCPNVQKFHIKSNDLENVPSDIFRHFKPEWRDGIEILKLTKCSVSLETLNAQHLHNVTLVEFDECEVIEVDGLNLLNKLFTSFPKLSHIKVTNSYSGDALLSISLKKSTK